jgi:pimeloyl-ACP methyl ester carboxylesterase
MLAAYGRAGRRAGRRVSGFGGRVRDRLGWVAVLAVGCLLAAGISACGASTPAPLGLGAAHPCRSADIGDIATDPPGVVPNVPVEIRFSCATLSVPLDHGLLSGPPTQGRLALRVAMADNVDAPRGVLFWLVGGPGEPGVPLAADIASGFDPAVLRDYRLVFLSARGTGDGALRCPELQQAVGGSDLAVPPPGAVTACARDLGADRRFYSTASTVADLDALRAALGVPTVSLDGASYGTFVAERYAMTYPDRVARLVLDSVVPHDGLDPMELDAFVRTADVLRMVCRETGCGTDPAQDLSTVVRVRRDGPALLDTLSDLSSGRPDLAGVPAALHDAVEGDYTALDRMVAATIKGSRATADELSAGLHAATTCQDMVGPWGGAASPAAGRAAATAAAVAAVADTAFFPFDRATATDNGQVAVCQQWPATPVVPFAAGRDLPPVPVLVLAGDHDLNTPLAWGEQELARAPRGRLVVVPGAGHVTQDHANGAGGREAVRQFLLEP